jgi:hypothetical protein
MRRKHLERGIKGEYMVLGVIAEKAKQKSNDPNDHGTFAAHKGRVHEQTVSDR